jgi:hypothetical protein
MRLITSFLTRHIGRGVTDGNSKKVVELPRATVSNRLTLTVEDRILLLEALPDLSTIHLICNLRRELAVSEEELLAEGDLPKEFQFSKEVLGLCGRYLNGKIEELKGQGLAQRTP